MEQFEQDLEDRLPKEWKQNRNFFRENKGEMVKLYGDKGYVVINNQQPIDHGQDEFELARKHNDKKHAFYGNLGKEEVKYIDSPEL